MSTYMCPVCEWPNLYEDPTGLSYEICRQCGTEFGADDPEDYPKRRERWISLGRKMWAMDAAVMVEMEKPY
jgi:uncharacterized protein (DUF983 family)